MRMGAVGLQRTSYPDGSTCLLETVADDGQDGTSRLLQNEYALREHLDASWAAIPIEFTRELDRTALRLANPGGVLLRHVCGVGLDIARTLAIGRALAEAVAAMHFAGVLHRDLTPDNILLRADDRQVWLTGFGNAVVEGHEPKIGPTHGVVVSSFTYLAPELSGRLNRTVDFRADLYSVGCILFELVTGSPVLAESDLLEAMHSQLASRPPKVHEVREGVPRVLSEIIAKLLAKDADDRYGGAQGLAWDLERCCAEWSVNGAIKMFSLDHTNAARRLTTSTRIYGRETEATRLLQAFDRVAHHGGTRGLLIVGASGSGKSALALQVPDLLGDRRFVFASGKCGEVEAMIPYGCIATAMNSLLDVSLKASEDIFQSISVRLQESLGSNVGLLTPLLPELRLFVPQASAPKAVYHHVDKERFLEAVRRFLACFASKDAPLVVFIDDLQWADAGTLAVIEYIQHRERIDGLLLIGAARTQVVDSSEWMVEGEHSPDFHYGFPEVECLSPLDTGAIANLVVDTLGCDMDSALTLAELVFTKTNGNPFFTLRFFGSLLDESLIVFDRATFTWRWNLERIRAKGFTSNVIDFLLVRVKSLDASCLHALQCLACLGDQASLEMLSVATGRDEIDLQKTLARATNAELVRWNGSAYAFWHDRIRETVYLTISRGTHPSLLHAEIGRRLVEKNDEVMPRVGVFVIANQLNLGIEGVSVISERVRFGEVNLHAGIEAKRSADYHSAFRFFTYAARFFGSDIDENTRQLIAFHTAECEFMTGQLEDAEKRLRDLIVRPLDPTLASDIVRLRCALYTTAGDISTAINVGLAFLRIFGVHFSLVPSIADTQRVFERLVLRLDEHAAGATRIGHGADARWSAIMDVLADLIPPVLFSNNPTLNSCISMTLATIALEHGCCGSSSYGLVCAASSLLHRFHDAKRGVAASEMALALSRSDGRDRLAARVLMVFGACVMPWVEPARDARRYIKEAAGRAYDDCDLTFAVYCRRNMVSNLIFSGTPLSELEDPVNDALAFASQSGFKMIQGAVLAQVMLISSLRGHYQESLASYGFDATWPESLIADSAATSPGAFAFWVHKLQLAVLFRTWSDALTYEKQATEIAYASAGHLEAIDLPLYGALARAHACMSDVSDAERAAHLEQVRGYHAHLVRLALNCPENFACRAALVGAELARVEGRSDDAQEGYEHAISLAREQGFLQIEALAYEVAANFYESRRLRTISDVLLRNARSTYKNYGASEKVRDVESRLPRMPDPTVANVFRRLESQIDTEAVIVASRALSSEMRLPRLLDVLLKNVVVHAGATRCVVALLTAGHLRSEAMADTTDTGVEVTVASMPLQDADVPASIMLTVSRTHRSVLLDHAAEHRNFHDDPVVSQRQIRSILCLPLLKQSSLVGVLYVENSHVSGAFTPDKMRLMEVLASQAAISLENARLYAETVDSNSRRAAAEEALRRSRDELARIARLNTMGQMVASIVHEVSQPLVSIATGAGAALRWLNRTQPNLIEAGEALERIRLDSTRASDIVVGLRSLARRSLPNFRAFDLNEAAREVLLLTRGEIDKRSVEVRASGLDGSCGAWGDRVQIQQVIFNLVLNAIEALSEISGHRYIALSTSRINEFVTLVVEDNGPGIPEAERERIFAPFITTKEGGMGMGLSICANIIEIHKGVLSVSQAGPYGTKFEATIPAGAPKK